MTKKEKSQQSKEPPKYIRVLKILSIFSLCLTMLLLGVVNGATYVVKTDIGQDILEKVSIALRPHTPTIMWLCFALLTILTQLGISPTSAIRMFYSQIVRENGLPLSLQLSSVSPTVTDDTSLEEIDAEPTKEST